MEEKRGLRWLIQQEGLYQQWGDVPEDVREEVRIGYEEGMRLVLDLYKPACRCRHVVDGGYVNVGSLQGFRSFIQACEDAATRAPNAVIVALLLQRWLCVCQTQWQHLPAGEVKLSRVWNPIWSIHVRARR